MTQHHYILMIRKWPLYKRDNPLRGVHVPYMYHSALQLFAASIQSCLVSDKCGPLRMAPSRLNISQDSLRAGDDWIFSR